MQTEPSKSIIGAIGNSCGAIQTGPRLLPRLRPVLLSWVKVMALRVCLIAVVAFLCALAADYSAPAGSRPAVRRPGAPSILPGGRIIAPLGRQYLTGPGPFGLAVSPDGKTIVSVNSGPERFSISILEHDKTGSMTSRHLLADVSRKHEE